MTQYTKKTARNQYTCIKCNKTIKPGDKNYVEEQRFLGSLHAKPKRLCVECYESSYK